MQYIYQSPLGRLIVTIMNDQITAIAFNSKQFAYDSSLRGSASSGDEAISSENISKMTGSFSANGRIRMTQETALTKKIQKQFDSYFAGKHKTLALPLQYEGTPFQKKVWKYLQSIPYGKTVSYYTVAKAIGHPKSARAVGTACKRNPIPIIIPCHRVISATGEIGEYAGGKTRKTKLLKLEQG